MKTKIVSTAAAVALFAILFALTLSSCSPRFCGGMANVQKDKRIGLVR